MKESNHPTFTHAIVRPPAENFCDGLTTQDLGIPTYKTALEQHAAYCDALRACGLDLVELPADPAFPDAEFVEDAAILIPEAAILTRPGAASRAGEVESIRETLTRFYHRMYLIQAPGTVDGGDICEAGRHFFIGISERTNVAGAVQLAEILAGEGYTTDLIDIRGTPGILHLKSGLSYLGDETLVVIDALADNPVFRDFRLLPVLPKEAYAANCVRVNDFVLVPAGFPGLQKTLDDAGFQSLPLQMSEFQKMDGGLSCLSLRF